MHSRRCYKIHGKTLFLNFAPCRLHHKCNIILSYVKEKLLNTLLISIVCQGDHKSCVVFCNYNHKKIRFTNIGNMHIFEWFICINASIFWNNHRNPYLLLNWSFHQAAISNVVNSSTNWKDFQLSLSIVNDIGFGIMVKLRVVYKKNRI